MTEKIKNLPVDYFKKEGILDNEEVEVANLVKHLQDGGIVYIGDKSFIEAKILEFISHIKQYYTPLLDLDKVLELINTQENV